MSTHCPECGNHFLSSDASEAQARISDLETQVRLLNSKAASYIEKIADYESHIRSLQAECTKLLKERDQTRSATPLSPPQAQSQKDGLLQIPPPTPEKDSVPQKIAKRPSLSRLSTLSSYLPMRKSHDVPEVPPIPPIHSAASQSTPVLATPSPEWMRSLSLPPSAIDPGRYPQSVTLIGLQTSLETERQLRQQAESSLAQSQSELEELTAQLFGQANEMVATERKARAKLEERVKLLETRDGEKRRRLDRLEKAVDRIERVRRMVVAHEKEMGDDAYIQTEIVQSQGQNRKVGRTTIAR